MAASDYEGVARPAGALSERRKKPSSMADFAQTGFTQSWRVGDVRVTRIVELEIGGGTRFILPDATPEACAPLEWMAPHFMKPDGTLVMSVHALVIEAGDRRIMVDTCIGNDKVRNVPAWDHMTTTFLTDLEAAGFPPETIDTVLCTHLHVDHVGWNTRLVDGVWEPTFKNARYLFAETEWRHWDANDDETVYGPVLADSVRPVVEAGLVDLVEMSHQVCPEVRLEPTPGHTPGHVSVHINSAGHEALITGDCIHHPCQMSRTDWCSSADSDQAEGRRTRESLLARYCDTEVLIIGTHFATPTAGYVKARTEGGYWLDVS
ncbi:MAG: MBL fold metallo-hydrolase [Pseudomonadota bacterium]